jgi:hypothetical protein
MDSSTLFSHPDVPEPVSSRDGAEEPVENPTFSDGPDANTSSSAARRL